jgi:hypothetical protein
MNTLDYDSDGTWLIIAMQRIQKTERAAPRAPKRVAAGFA